MGWILLLKNQKVISLSCIPDFRMKSGFIKWEINFNFMILFDKSYQFLNFLTLKFKWKTIPPNFDKCCLMLGYNLNIVFLQFWWICLWYMLPVSDNTPPSPLLLIPLFVSHHSSPYPLLILHQRTYPPPLSPPTSLLQRAGTVAWSWLVLVVA